MTRFDSWLKIEVGTIVSLRRQTGEHTKAWTASGPYYSDSGIACIRVDIGGAVVGYPLDRVSLGWEEPLLPLAMLLDPPPVVAPPGDFFVSLALGVAALYFVAIGGAAFAAWVLR
jgi:hypothetical protein